MIRRLILPSLVLLLLAAPSAGSDYLKEIETWHAERIERLRAPDGWLSLVGLIALPEGRSTLGCGEKADLRIQSRGEALIGELAVEGQTVRFTARTTVLHGDEPVDQITLAADVTGDPTVLHAGSISFYLILRHERPYLRVKDAEAELLEEFSGIDRFAVDEAWRVNAQWVEYEEPVIRSFPDVLGLPNEGEVTGEARFTVGGQEYVLYPNGVGEDWMFWVFGDATNGLETYGAGRFLYTDAVDASGHVVLDFNKSYNPPCVFTPYATCPLPAPGNTLELEVHAGEKMFGAGH